MPLPLIATKLHTPSIRHELVSRPRLLEQLDACLDHKLTLISAPAGFGKTTLLLEWIRSRSGVIPPPNIAWLSLDEGDNDLSRFWTYIAAALEQASPGAGAEALAALRSSAMVNPAGAVSVESVVVSLLNQIAELPAPLILVVDDCHLIESPSVYNALVSFLEHLPDIAHLVLSTRVDPPLPLPRLRVRRELVEIREADLRFTSEEAITFLNQTMGLDIPNAAVEALDARTEGWIAGLQMAALSLQDRDAERINTFIDAFTGSNRYILDYLLEEVLYREPEHVQAFLLQTSILDQLNGPLCDAVCTAPDGSSGATGGQSMLERLETRNLFLVPLDDRREWYRYHHLFAELLRNRLKRQVPAQVADLHRRASCWYDENHMIAGAVKHALAANDLDQTVHLIEANAFELMDHGELAAIIKWLDALPSERVRTRPRLCVVYAWALMHSGQMDAVESWLLDAERAPGSASNTVGTIAAIRAYIAAAKGAITLAIELAHQALDRLPPASTGHSTVRAFTAAILSSLYRFQGDFPAAARAITEAIAISREKGNDAMAALASCNLAGTLIVQGQLHKAATLFRETLGLGGKVDKARTQNLPFSGLAATGLANVLREWNDLENAARFAQMGVEQSRRWGQVEVVLHGYIELAQILQALGDRQGAWDAIHQAKQTAHDLSSWGIISIEAIEARLHLEQGNLTSASRWARESKLDVNGDLVFRHMVDYITLARVLVARGQERASRLLARLLEMAQPAGATGYEIEISALQALACAGSTYHDRDAQHAALDYLAHALSLAEPEGYVRVFVSQGPPMLDLLRKAAARGIAVAHVGRLLDAFAQETANAERAPGRLETLIEPLSERELEVLRLIVAGLSNKEIAQELVLAIGTVKKHINNIYGKLGVQRRAQAIRRTQELALL